MGGREPREAWGQLTAMGSLNQGLRDVCPLPGASSAHTHSTSRFRMVRPEARTSATLDTMGS